MVVTVQEAPDDVTGAAGVLAGGCGGGASWELAALLGWLVAGPAPVCDGEGTGEPAVDAGGGLTGDWLAAGRTVLAWPADAKAAARAVVAPTAPAVIASDSDLMRPNTRCRCATAQYDVA